VANSTGEDDFKGWLEASVREWGPVDSRRMFGAQVYMAGGKMFVALGEMGLLLKLPAEVRTPLIREGRAEAFTVTTGASFGEWVALMPNGWQADREGLLRLVRQSFDYVQEVASSAKPPRTTRRFRKRQY